ncbi:hypothetical protein [Haloechinothrix halophila]|uniref:hypothetical protein n=1 Tax=Haloechinothrix halophila TaxID=1069073 RepID=UPI00040FCA70|nr:hypothetical protein [Haloechinothrix halophila]
MQPHGHHARNWAKGLGVAVLTALAIGIPSDVIDTGLFSRMVPVRSWEYVALPVVAVLAGVWAAIPRRAVRTRANAGVLGSLTGALFAVACPVCNKIILALLGASGALSIWAPVQPVLAVVSVLALVAAVVVRWRQRCDGVSCAVAESDASYESAERTPSA